MINKARGLVRNHKQKTKNLVVKAQLARHNESNKANVAERTVSLVRPLQPRQLKEPCRLRHSIEGVHDARGHRNCAHPAVQRQKVLPRGLVHVNSREARNQDSRCGKLQARVDSEQSAPLGYTLSLKAHGHGIERRRVNACCGREH